MEARWGWGYKERDGLSESSLKHAKQFLGNAFFIMGRDPGHGGGGRGGA